MTVATATPEATLSETTDGHAADQVLARSSARIVALEARRYNIYYSACNSTSIRVLNQISCVYGTCCTTFPSQPLARSIQRLTMSMSLHAGMRTVQAARRAVYPAASLGLTVRHKSAVSRKPTPSRLDMDLQLGGASPFRGALNFLNGLRPPHINWHASHGRNRADSGVAASVGSAYFV
jgi:hypothetical protein